MPRPWKRNAAIALAALALVGASAAVVPTIGHAEQGPAAAPVTLITGERVHVAGDVAPPVEPAASSGRDPARIRTLTAGGHLYVVSDKAMPYLGRQLDLSLFDVLAPPAPLQVEWAPGATPHDIDNLDV